MADTGGYKVGNLFKQEPAILVALFQSIVAAVVAFGFDLPAEAVAGVVAAVGVLLNVLYVRPSVTPSG